MTIQAQTGEGVSLKRGNGASPEVFASIAEINSVNLSGLSKNTIDVTTFDSASGYKEFITGFKDSGELTFNMNFTPVNFEQIKIDFEAKAKKNYRIILADTAATQFDFAANVIGLTLAIPLEDKIVSDVTMKITGVINTTS